MDQNELIRQKSRVTYIAALINLFLSVIKVSFGILGQSTALIADGIHSLSDLASDGLVLIAVRLGSREADDDHPYGHARFETMATIILGLTLILVAGGIAWDAVERLLYPARLLIPDVQTLGVAAISILANEWLYHYTRRIAKITRSKLLLANAWHHRSDAISSVVVLIGIAAVLTGYVYADAIAAVIVGIMIAKIGVSLVLESVRELVDTSLPDDQVAKIRNQIAGTDGVKAIHLIRTRKMGEDAYVDLHIQVDSHISVSEGHMIADSVRDNLRHNFEDIADVLVHTDPEDDEFKPETTLPPSRAIILKNLSNLWGGFYEQVREVNIHYLDGHVELEIILPLILATQHNQQELIADKCREVEQTMAIVSKTTVLFSV
jgi:cation diffusion facilitator family transporter